MLRTSNPPAATAKDAPGRQPGQPIKSWAENTGKLSRFRKENGIVGAGGHRSLYRSLTTPVKLSVGGEWALQECEKLTSWANSHLKRKKFRLVNDLRKSMSDGLTLVNLIECLTSEKVPNIQTRPIIRAQKTENLQKCLYYLEGKGVPIQDITAKDLAEGHLKATLTIVSRLKEIFDVLSTQVNGTSEPGEEGEKTESRPHSAPSSGTERLGNGDGEADTSLSESLELEPGRLYPGDDPNEVRHAYYDDRAISHQKPVYSGGGLREDLLPGSMATDDEEEDISQSEIPPTLQSTTEMGSHGVSQHGADSRRQIIGLTQAIREKARISVSTEVPGSPNKLQAWDTQAMFTAPTPVRDQVSLTVEERLKSLLDSPYLEEMAGSPRKKGYLEGELLLPPPPKGHSPFSYPDGIDNPGLEGGMNSQVRSQDVELTELGLGSGYVPSHPNQKGRVSTRGEAVLRMRGAGRTEAYSNGPPTQQLVNGSPNIRGRPVAGEHSPGRSAAHKPSPGPPGRPSGQERRDNPHPQPHQPSKTPPTGKKGVPPPAYGQQDRSHIPGGQPHPAPHHSGPGQPVGSRLYLHGGHHHPQQRIHAGSSQQSQTRQFWLQQQQDQQHLQWQKPHDLEEDSRQPQPEPTSRPIPAPRSRPPNSTPSRGQPVPNSSNTPQRVAKTSSSSSSYSSPSTLSPQSATTTKQGRIPPPYPTTSTPSKADSLPEHHGSFVTNLPSKIKANMTQHLPEPPATSTVYSKSNPGPDLDVNFSGTGTISETSSRSSTPPLPPLSPSNTPPITPPGSPIPIVRPTRSMSTTVLPSAHVSPITQTDRKKTESGRKGRKGSTRVGRSASTLQVGFSMLGKKKGSGKNGNSLRGDSREDDSQSEEGESMSLSEAELVRQQLTALEEMYREILRLLGADQTPRGPSTLTRKPTLTKLKRAGSSLGKPASVVKQRAKDIRSVNRRFARLESHVVTLARSVAHLSSELRTQNALVQEIELLRQELENLKEQQKILQRQQLAQRKPPDRHQSHSRNTPLLVLPVKNSARLAKLTKFFGAEPPLLSIFLKKIGYEKYVKNFEAESIGILELPYMNEDRLKQIGVPMGPRVRILQEAKAALL